MIIEKLEDISGICNNCWNRTHKTERQGKPTKTGPVVELSIVDKQYFAIPSSTEWAAPPNRPTEGRPSPKNVCTICGIFDKDIKDRPLSKQKMMEYTHNLSDRLDEYDVRYKKSVLFETTKQLKSDPEENHLNDDKIWDKASQQAIREKLKEENG